MIEFKTPADRLADALFATLTCSGTSRHDPDTYQVVRFAIWGSIGIALEATDTVAAARSWVPLKADVDRPDSEADLTVNVVDSAGRLRGLVAYAAKADEMLTITVVDEPGGMPGFEKRSIRLALERETIKATTLGTATPKLDALFEGFTATGATSVYLPASCTDRLAKMTKAVGPVTTDLADGLIRVSPAGDPGFDFEAIMSVAAPSQ